MPFLFRNWAKTSARRFFNVAGIRPQLLGNRRMAGQSVSSGSSLRRPESLGPARPALISNMHKILGIDEDRLRELVEPLHSGQIGYLPGLLPRPASPISTEDPDLAAEFHKEIERGAVGDVVLGISAVHQQPLQHVLPQQFRSLERGGELLRIRNDPAIRDIEAGKHGLAGVLDPFFQRFSVAPSSAASSTAAVRRRSCSSSTSRLRMDRARDAAADPRDGRMELQASSTSARHRDEAPLLPSLSALSWSRRIDPTRSSPASAAPACRSTAPKGTSANTTSMAVKIPRLFERRADTSRPPPNFNDSNCRPKVPDRWRPINYSDRRENAHHGSLGAHDRGPVQPPAAAAACDMRRPRQRTAATSPGGRFPRGRIVTAAWLKGNLTRS